jgi:hypothetical protein
MYLISFPASAMQVSAEDLPHVSRDANEVIERAKEAGVYVFAAGISTEVPPVMVDADGSVTEGTYPQTNDFDGGLTVLELPDREAALEWAARIAKACRCAQEVREVF